MVIFKFRKTGRAKFLSHLEMMRLVKLAIRRAGIDVEETKKGAMKIYFSPATPIGVESEVEFVEIDMDETAHKVADELKTYLPEGIEITGEYDTKGRMFISQTACLAKYKIEIDGISDLQKKISEVLSSAEFFVKLKMNGKISTESVNTLIHSFSFDKGNLVLLGFTGENNLSITQTILQLLSTIGRADAEFKIKKTNLFSKIDERFHDVELLLMRNKV
ncbi:MAG: DUF2344 domain-containing protein [Clostridia bacterium]|nr:DUF2344 domain-containing protein [Clostridia bacterium]